MMPDFRRDRPPMLDGPQPPDGSSRRPGKRISRLALAVVIATSVVAVGVAIAGRIGIRVYKPAKMACQGTPIKVGLRAQGAARGFRISIVDPAKKRVFSKKGRAPKKWRYWLYTPAKLGVFRTEYRTALGKRRFSTQVSNCEGPVESPAPLPPPAPSPPAPPPPPPPPGCGAEVCLVDNDVDTAMFTMSNMVPGSTEAGCIKVTYSGTLNSTVKLYGTTTGSGLDQFLNLRVTRGAFVPTEPAFDSCANFVSDDSDHLGAGAGVIYNGTLQAWGDDFASGLLDPSDCLAPPCAAEAWTDSESHVYRFEITLQDDNSAQGRIATQTFTWEARDAP
jgi:hypothetical protein